MPSTITHTYFAMDVYDRLPIDRREFLLDFKGRMKISAQSMDPLFFYNITNFKKGKKVRKFGNYFHTHHVFLFFETLINYIKYNGYGYDPEIMAFLYGMLCHYILDSNTHPYIIYFTGDYHKDKPETLKYNHLHGEVETLIDNYMIQTREQMLPWKFNCIPFCFQFPPMSDSLKEVIDFSFRETFGISHMSDYYDQATKQMKFFFQVFRTDFFGIKKLGYQVIDFICPKTLLRKSVLSYHQKVLDQTKLLNLDHKKWYNPTTKRIHSKESFLDLYLKSMFETVKIINKIDEYIYDDKKISLKRLLKNNSYVTGLNCEKESELKYFYF